MATRVTEPEIDATATAERIIERSDCASDLALGDHPLDRFPEVFATTRMIALMELAGARLLHPLLQPGEMSVGVTVDVIHSVATPIGARATATARYRGQDGKLFVFDIVARDSAGEIGRGTHKRAIVARDRLVAGAAKRAARA